MVVLLTACQAAPASTQAAEPAYGAIMVRQKNVPTVGLGIGEQEARKRLQQGLRIEKIYPASAARQIATADEAIAAAEPVLFEQYGRENILSQRPYEGYLLDGFWFIQGTLPAGGDVVGGTFEIAFTAKSGRIVHLTHYE
ncbi:NTF2 fold immunity protein [Hymenobacter edaphi]|nr:NTF2 fold immunity protein [Hymenobacter edaphi]